MDPMESKSSPDSKYFMFLSSKESFKGFLCFDIMKKAKSRSLVCIIMESHTRIPLQTQRIYITFRFAEVQILKVITEKATGEFSLYSSR